MPLNKIDHIIFLMLENRSFDHLLGYLSLDETPNALPVDGLRSSKEWQESYANLAGGKSYRIKKMPALPPVKQDPPHDKAGISTQIDTAPAGTEVTKMGGFVKAFREVHPNAPDPGVVLGYHDAADVPTYDFLARNFCVCDKWFTPLPLGTQANRLMAMAGEARIADNVVKLPDQKLVYDWLNEKKIPWRVYVSGGFAPLFILMRRWSLAILKSLALGNGHFRRFGAFRRDWLSNTPAPSVIFLEPEYSDAPMSHPNDDHPPAAVTGGQAFVREIYEAVTSNPSRWQKTLLIVTYDEHGGFFDHVPPLPIGGAAGKETFTSTGPRVPALLVSPHVEAGQVYSEPLDHTSVLALIAERFGDGEPYSAAVAKRQKALGRIADALRASGERTAPPLPPAKPSQVQEQVLPSKIMAPTAPETPNAAAIDAVMRDLALEHPEVIEQPGWAEMKRYLDANLPPVPRHHGHIV